MFCIVWLIDRLMLLLCTGRLVLLMATAEDVQQQPSSS
jgi:hypothetical protein